jgi:glycosyltransferase involved in cell wall biosynthesis
MMDDPSMRGDAIEVGVVIPSFKQPGFLTEALESVLRQTCARRIGAVIVNDGCPFEQTHATGLAYARRYPDRIFYLRRANGGLSAARNTGLDFALAAWPACRGIYPLDSDNRLGPHFLERALGMLDASPQDVGWIYPDFDFFGLDGNFSTTGEYSHFMQIAENYCEAGSLVRRDVFAAGLRFDERMRLGFEDWDFWLRAAQAGWRGRHLPAAGFQYRKRAESMLAGSERLRSTIIGDMRVRYGRHLHVRALAPLEAAEVPRFALHVLGEEEVRLLLDPMAPAPRREKRAAARARFVEASREPRATHYPPHFCFTSPQALALLRRTGLLRNVFYQAMIALREAHFLAVTVTPGAAGELGLTVTPPRSGGEAGARAVMVFARTQLMQEVARDPHREWIESLASQAPHPKLAELALTLPAGMPVEDMAQVLPLLLAEVDALRDCMLSRSSLPATWRTDERRPRIAAQNVYHELTGCGAILPHLAPGDRRDIGFLLPLFAFGGVEKVIFNYASEMRRMGWRPHLFIAGAQHIQVMEDHFEVFESVNFFEGAGIEGGDYDSLHFGACLSGFGLWRDMRDAVGLLATMDVVLNTHSVGGHGLMQALRGQGVQTWLGLHLVEQGPLGNPLGNPHIALAYEAAYEGFVVISDRLRDWCLGQSVPEDKVVKVFNAPSYQADPARLAQALAARRQPQARALRALYLGRLDAQKGLERLRDIVLQTRGAQVEWRLVGKAVLNDAAVNPGGWGVEVEPPAVTAAELDALYAWADVVVLPSRFEGVPLTVLEAQRFGCVVIATDVGAVAEIIKDGIDGFLVPVGAGDFAVVAAFVATLDRLVADRELRRQVGLGAAARLAGSSWGRNMGGWMERLGERSRRAA